MQKQLGSSWMIEHWEIELVMCNQPYLLFEGTVRTTCFSSRITPLVTCAPVTNTYNKKLSNAILSLQKI